MKKSLIVLFLLFCIGVQAQSKFSSWEVFADHNLSHLESVSYSLKRTSHYANGQELVQIFTVFVDTANFFLFDKTSDTTLLHVSSDSISLIEYGYANISYGPREFEKYGMNIYGYIRHVYSCKMDVFAPFYYFPGETKLGYNLEEIRDTVIDETSYAIMKFSQQITWTFNEETQKCDIPVTDYIWLYCNSMTFWVDKVVVSQTPDGTGRYDVYEFGDFRKSEPVGMDFSLFRKEDRRYEHFAKYDFTKEIAPSVIGYAGNDSLLSDEVLEFPLVNAQKDTVRLGNVQGWILLDFWRYGCTACARFWSELQREKDSLGYSRLDNEGIRLFSINNESGVTKKFVDITNRFHAQDFMYAARGLEKLYIRITPTYYLFAPNHDLVYYGRADNIIDTLLDAKKRYEQTHREQLGMSQSRLGAVISVDKDEYDFGDIEEDGDGKTVFVVRNTGDSPLLIDHVSSSCGCTTAEYPENPIEPGKTGNIVVRYNTKQLGSFRKTLLVVSNAVNEQKKVLKIKGRVLPMPKS